METGVCTTSREVGIRDWYVYLLHDACRVGNVTLVQKVLDFYYSAIFSKQGMITPEKNAAEIQQVIQLIIKLDIYIIIVINTI